MTAAAQQVDDTHASTAVPSASEHFEDDDVLNSLPPNSQRHRPDGGEHRETFLPSDSIVVDGINHGRVYGLDDSDDGPDGDGREGDANEATSPGKAKDRKPCYKRAWKRWRKIYAANSFLILVVCAILLALAYPPLGAVYLAPQITATWIAVIFIFVLAGLGLRTSELSKALSNIWFNTVVQCYNFFVVSSVVFGVSRFLISVGALARALADGMVIGCAVPMTINMVLVLTKSSGGDEASAVFNAAFGNLTGVFLTPVLILGYLGVSGDIDLVSVFYKLGLRVVLPIAVGQLLQKFSKTFVNFVKKYKKYFKQAQEYCLVFIIYTVFCRTFLEGSEAKAADIFIMIAIQFVLLCSLMVLAWYLMKLLFRNRPKLRVMGLYGCTHKTVAMGVPLINAIYESNPNVGLYTLPLLIWHPMQLVIGSALAPRIAQWVEREENRLENENNCTGDGEDGLDLSPDPTEVTGDIEGGESNDTIAE
mmetsp:Transcript_18930/g.54555  ORF Transcript_18930/g.54555 Transcript_18930/m.54555 type:complete len:478 (-) Transcript_18930:23-1456(-)